jgi:hypothetical protein
MINEQQRRVIVARLTARGWRDPEFQRALVENPRPILEEAGLTLPRGIEIRAVENTATTQYIVVPRRPEWVLDRDLNNLAILIPMACGYEMTPLQRPRTRPSAAKSGTRSTASAGVGAGAGVAKSRQKRGAKKKGAKAAAKRRRGR